LTLFVGFGAKLLAHPVEAFVRAIVDEIDPKNKHFIDICFFYDLRKNFFSFSLTFCLSIAFFTFLHRNLVNRDLLN